MVAVRRLTADDGGTSRRRPRGDLRAFAFRRGDDDRSRSRFERGDDDRSRGRFGRGDDDRSRGRFGRGDDDRRAAIAAIVVIADIKAETTEVQAEAEIVGFRGVGRESEERGAEERGQGPNESVAAATVAVVREVGVLFHRCVS